MGMEVKIWGARGSHPQPMTAECFQERIRGIIQRVRSVDISSNENRECFLASLPDWLWKMPGGNTPCVEIQLADGNCLIFDAGTGIVPLSKKLHNDPHSQKVFHLFFSHFHYDHIQGLPFFAQAYLPETELHFYSPEKGLKAALQGHMHHPFFPVSMEEKMTEQQFFHVLDSEATSEKFLRFGETKIYWRKINHPGNSYAYKLVEGGKTLIIATDYEIENTDFERTKENSDFFADCDVLILDTMYTLNEAIEKYNWGHSSFSMGVDFAHVWNTRRLLLFHHDPSYSDKQLYGILQKARLYAERQNYANLQIDIAEEGMKIVL